MRTELWHSCHSCSGLRAALEEITVSFKARSTETPPRGLLLLPCMQKYLAVIVQAFKKNQDDNILQIDKGGVAKEGQW